MLKFAPRTRKPRWRRLRGAALAAWWQRTLFQPGSADRVARGAAIGFFIGWLPLIGVQTPLALGLCLATRSNFLASVPGVWLSNPFTMLPMYWFINWVGAHFAGRAVSWRRMQEIWDTVGNLGFVDATRYLFAEAAHATLAMFIGGVIVGTLFAARLVHRYQEHWARRRAHWRDRTSGPKPTQAA